MSITPHQCGLQSKYSVDDKGPGITKEEREKERERERKMNI